MHGMQPSVNSKKELILRLTGKCNFVLGYGYVFKSKDSTVNKFRNYHKSLQCENNPIKDTLN